MNPPPRMHEELHHEDGRCGCVVKIMENGPGGRTWCLLQDEGCDTFAAPIEKLHRPVKFEALPVEANAGGRHRPAGHVTVKQDPAERARKRVDMTTGAEKLVECVACGGLFASLRDHPCDESVMKLSMIAPIGGSCTFATVKEQLDPPASSPLNAPNGMPRFKRDE